jgi:hypothetical protein
MDERSFMSSKKSPASSDAGQRNAPKPTDLDSTAERAAPAGEFGSEGISGAPPCNTAPYNCNFTYQPLRWGIDSLYLSYPGTLSGDREFELRSLKKIAQGLDYEASKAQIQLGDHFFEVKDKSSGLFAFTLVDDAYMIRLSAGKSKKLPMAYVQVSSRLLSHSTPVKIEEELRAILRSLGEVYSPKVSRADLYLDFASNLDMEGWRRNAWVTRAKAVAQYAEDVDFTGWTVGAGGALSARLYQKIIESKKSGKEYLHELWRIAGWDGVTPVWRMEFQYKREVLDQLGLDSLPALLDHLGGLWSYATTDWLRLCTPNEDDKTRARWPVHPLWIALATVDWNKHGGPLTRTYTASRAPSMDWLGLRCASVIASIGAIAGLTDFDAAAAEAKKQAYDALALKNGMSGISVDQFFKEKGEALTREYNLRMNPKAATPAPTVSGVRNEYERQSRG